MVSRFRTWAILAVLMAGISVLAIGCQSEAPEAPTPNIQATVDAAVEAAVEAALSQVTPAPTPESGQQPIPFHTAVPHTPVPHTAVPGEQAPAPTVIPTQPPAPTPTHVPAPAASPTPAPIDTPIPVPTPDPSVPGYGPASGSIPHHPEDGALALATGAGPRPDRDALIEATFHNPYEAGEKHWDYGMLLTGEEVSHYHWIRIHSNDEWTHSYRLGSDVALVSVRQEFAPAIDKTTGGKNRIALITREDEGELFINGQSQGTIDLGAVDFTQVWLVVGTEEPGQVTRFQDFSIWKWHPSLAQVPARTPTPVPALTDGPLYGPVSGAIVHELESPENLFELFQGPVIREDVMVDVTFHNPYATTQGNWNYGLLLRSNGPYTHHWIALSPSRWTHRYNLRTADDTQEVRNRRSLDIDSSAGGKNHLRLVMIEDSLWVFVNGNLQGHTSLEAIPGGGPIILIVNDEQEGVTRFEDFTVWNWDPSLQELP